MKSDYKLQRIISGGQTGVDIAALRAAKSAGYLTGGFMPHGYKNHTGDHPEYLDMYGMIDTPSSSYKQRTEENVKHSNATLQIAVNFDSPGEICTSNAVAHNNKPLARVHVSPAFEMMWFEVWGGLRVARTKIGMYTLAAWMIEHQTLNIAGNSERTVPGIELYAERFIFQLLWIIGECKARETS